MSSCVELNNKLNKNIMDSKEILKRYCKAKYGNEIVIKTYDIQEIKQIIDFTHQLLIQRVSSSFSQDDLDKEYDKACTIGYREGQKE